MFGGKKPERSPSRGPNIVDFSKAKRKKRPAPKVPLATQLQQHWDNLGLEVHTPWMMRLLAVLVILILSMLIL